MYSCNVCNLEYQDKKLAESCETSVPPEKPCEPGQEIKLLNKSSRTWTLALCKEIKLVPTKLSLVMVDGTYAEYAEAVHVNLEKNRHEWQLTLDKPVFLDKTWEDFKLKISSSHIIKDEKITNSHKRADNAG